MIVLVILSILMAFAVPNFNNLIISNQMASYLSDFADALRRAKIESSAKLKWVTICVRNGNACSNGNKGTWSDGWLVFVDNDGDAAVDSGDRILYQQQALGREITFKGTVKGTGNAMRRITFTPSGHTQLTQEAEMIMCDQSGALRRRIHMTVTGHTSPLDNDDIGSGKC